MSDNKRPKILLNERARITRREAVMDSLTTVLNKHVPVVNQIKGLRHMSKDKEEQNILAVEMVEWSCNADSYYIEKFPVSKGISPYRFFKVKHENEFFAECVELANSICHLNLKQAVHTGELHHAYVLAMLPVFDGDYRGYMIERISKKVAEYIKSQQAFSCSWIKELNDEPNEPTTQGDQLVQTQGIPEEVP